MQTIFIEENISHQQIINLCQLINSNACKSLEFRRCAIVDSDFDELMKSLSNNGKSLVSLIFNIQMIDEQHRFMKFIKMLSNCSNLVNLRVHGNSITDEMFSQLCSVLHENCLKLTSLDIGDNKLANQSIVNLCSLILLDGRRTGLEELILSANVSITHAGWTELFFCISFNSRIRRLALDYNTFDNTGAAMLSMVIASSRTLTYLDLECCHLTEYAGQLLLTLFTKYPVKLEEICLDRNASMLDSTRTLITECLGLKSRQNSISSEQPLIEHLAIKNNNDDDDSTSTNSTVNERVQPVKLRKKKKKTLTQPSPRRIIEDKNKTVSFDHVKAPEKPVELKKVIQYEEDEEDIEELLPIDPEPYGTVGRMVYWRRS